MMISISIIASIALIALITVTSLDLLCEDYLLGLFHVSAGAMIGMVIVLPFAILCYKNKIDKKYKKLIAMLKDSDEPEEPYFAR